MTGQRSYAVFSCDLDTVDLHLEGYGFTGLSPCDLVYRKAVPRLLDLFAELQVPGVLFMIARDAGRERALLRSTVAAGHEVASHSLTHPQPFRTLDDATLHEEIAGSRARLADATGTDIVGFRAPAWDVDTRVLKMVRAAGYRYDASVFPTPALITNRLATYRRSTGKRSIFAMDLFGYAFAPVRPHSVSNGAAGLTEFPIAVTRWLRFPVYHTLTYLVPRWLFMRALRALLRSGLPVCYEFHAADLLDLVTDGIDPRLARHPGMCVPVTQKRTRLREILAMIAAQRRVVTYQQALTQGLAA
ncbi:MAG TPA: polysaccharide deacetylase family protein [Candidatus Acidoferrales bacterium]|nr:polysaccharide deacetylase family protein [Candidatus Acidoferrales bacterium]